MAPIEIATKPSVSPQSPPTPPNSPIFPPFPQSIDDLKRLGVVIIKEAQKAEYTDKVQASASVAEKDVPPADGELAL